MIWVYSALFLQPRNGEARVTNYVSWLEEAVQLRDKRKIYEDSINSLWRLTDKKLASPWNGIRKFKYSTDFINWRNGMKEWQFEVWICVTSFLYNLMNGVILKIIIFNILQHVVGSTFGAVQVTVLRISWKWSNKPHQSSYPRRL